MTEYGGAHPTMACQSCHAVLLGTTVRCATLCGHASSKPHATTSSSHRRLKPRVALSSSCRKPGTCTPSSPRERLGPRRHHRCYARYHHHTGMMRDGPGHARAMLFQCRTSVGPVGLAHLAKYTHACPLLPFLPSTRVIMHLLTMPCIHGVMGFLNPHYNLRR
jgi:hypothetical protein